MLIIIRSKINSETLIQNLDVDDIGNYFYNKKVVITGTFSIGRQEMAEMLQSKGADVNTAISKKTNIVSFIVELRILQTLFA